MEQSQRAKIEGKIKSLVEINPFFSDQMKQEILEYVAEASDDDLTQVLHGLAAEDNARGKILQMNADDLRNLATKIKTENEEILGTFASLIQQAEAENQSNTDRPVS